MRSAKNIVKEIEQCSTMGVKEIFFFDDNFSANPKRVVEICDELIRKDLKVIWSFRGRVNTTGEEMLKKCKEAGCHRIHFGVETGTDEGLKRLKKDINVEMIKKAFKVCKKVGITSVANFIIGLPWETKEDMLHTIKFANEIDPDYAEFAILTPFPNTELYEESIKKGMFGDFWREFAKNPVPDFDLKTCNEHYSREELFKILDLCLKKFYFRPKRIMKILLQLRSKKEFKTKLKAGIALLNFKKMIIPKN
jgi:radical SAM superfamily enzyme YgiQ (UPF0313 family)